MNESIAPGHADLLSVFHLPCLVKMKQFSGNEWNTILSRRKFLNLHTNGKGVRVMTVVADSIPLLQDCERLVPGCFGRLGHSY